MGVLVTDEVEGLYTEDDGEEAAWADVPQSFTNLANQEGASRSVSIEEVVRTALKRNGAVQQLLQEEERNRNLPRSQACQKSSSSWSRSEAIGKLQETTPADGWAASIMYPDCFRLIREAFQQRTGAFARSLNMLTPLGAGSGISGASDSGARHFLSHDGDFYIKSLPNSAEVDTLLKNSGRFLRYYTRHVEQHPETLLSRLLAVIKLERPRSWTSKNTMYILVMDNAKRLVDSHSDTFLQFDLKGSKWKHRLAKEGGRRCHPLFSLKFWGSGQPPFQSDGEDSDFYAFRLRLRQEWFQEQAEVQHKELDEDRRYIAKERLEDLPLSDKCFLDKDWIEVKQEAAQAAGKTFDFCKEVQEGYKAAKLGLGNESDSVISTYVAKPHFCNDWLKGTLQEQQEAGWMRMVREEKMLFEGIRRRFGFPTEANQDLDQKPLVVAPTTHERLIAQIEKDVGLLSQHNIVDYSMHLVVKQEEASVDCPTLAKSEERDASFYEYKGGVRAVASGGEQPEKAIYFFKIMDFLSISNWKKDVSQTMQSMVAENKVQSRLPEVWTEFFQTVGTTPCSRLSKVGESEEPQYCWSDAGYSRCSTYVSKLDDASAKKLTIHKLAQFDFGSDHLSKLACSERGCLGENFGSKDRALCAITPKSMNRISIPMETPKSLPDHLRNMPEATVSSRFNREVKATLKRFMNEVTASDAPVAMRRISLLTYEDFARRPFREDTIKPDEYAERFLRYFGSWIQAPEEGNVERDCPDIAKWMQGVTEASDGEKKSHAMRMQSPKLLLTSLSILMLAFLAV